MANYLHGNRWRGRLVFLPEEGDGMLNVLDYGADPTGVADSTTAFQNAMNAETAGTVFAPKGTYLFSGHLNIPAGVQLIGDRRNLPTHTSQSIVVMPVISGSGTVFLVTEGSGNGSGTPFITLNNNSALQGVQLTWPNQVTTSPPTAYPWAIDFAQGLNGSIYDVFLQNPYQGIRCLSHYRPTIEKVGGSPFAVGLQIDNCEDVAHVNSIHWILDGNDAAGGSMDLWRKAHGIGFQIGRVDAALFSQCFCFGYNYGFLLENTASGSPWASFVQCATDECGLGFNILATQDASHPCIFTACYVTGASNNNNQAGGTNVIWGNNFPTSL